MKIKDFLKLSYGEANKHLKKAFSGRINGYTIDLNDLKGKLDLDDAIWCGDAHSAIPKDGPKNAAIRMEDRWYITQVRIILSLRYSDDIAINYYIGNTQDGVTLKEITFSGIGTYWDYTFESLEKLGIEPRVTMSIPEVTYGNGRKGSVSDFLNKKYNLLRLRIDYAIQEFTEMILDGRFEKTWQETKETDDITNRSLSRMKGELGNYAISLISDNSNLSLNEIVIYLKSMRGELLGTYPQRRSILRYFRGCHANFEGLPVSILGDLRELTRLVGERLDLDRKLDVLSGTIQASIQRHVDDFHLLHPEVSKEKLDSIFRVILKKEIEYEDLV